MTTQRRTYSAEYKAKIALEALQSQRSLNELAAEHGIHPNQIGQWRSQLLAAVPGIFSSLASPARRSCAGSHRRASRYTAHPVTASTPGSPCSPRRACVAVHNTGSSGAAPVTGIAAVPTTVHAPARLSLSCAQPRGPSFFFSQSSSTLSWPICW